MDVVLNWGQEREYYVAGDSMACNPVLKECYSYYFVLMESVFSFQNHESFIVVLSFHNFFVLK